MGGCSSVEEIGDLAASAVSRLTGGRAEGSFDGRVRLDGDPRATSTEGPGAEPWPVGPSAGVPDSGWAWVLPVSGPSAAPLVKLLFRSAEPPSYEDRAMLCALGEATSRALATVRRRADERAAAADVLRRASDLRMTLQIYDRLIRAAATVQGHTAIARALHELTGMTAVIEDRSGQVLAGAGPEYRQTGPGWPAMRQPWIKEAMVAGRPLWKKGRLVAPAV
jgi:hypothetical protein